jgi:hypothetical protein
MKNSIHSPLVILFVWCQFFVQIKPRLSADGIIYVGGKHELHIICHGASLALNKRQITSVAGDHLAR